MENNLNLEFVLNGLNNQTNLYSGIYKHKSNQEILLYSLINHFLIGIGILIKYKPVG